jgi:hypothetical protein
VMVSSGWGWLDSVAVSADWAASGAIKVMSTVAKRRAPLLDSWIGMRCSDYLAFLLSYS